jgi:dolichyl-phosphate beta-glucosyltransferase
MMDRAPKDTAIPYLSVAIPAYNEEHRIAESLAKLVEYLRDKDYTYEVLVTDDGSKDRTLDICRAFAAEHPWLRIIHYDANQGKGYAVRTGMMDARGEYVLLCDADLATPLEELDGFWRYVKDGCDVVIASRAVRESHLVERQPIHRELAGRMFNLGVRVLAVRGIHDTQCGFKLFRREAAQAVFQLCTLNGFSFDIEVLHIAQKLGYRIQEVGVHWYHRPGSKVRMLRDGMKMLRDLLKIRLRHRNLRRHTAHATG